MKRYRLWCLAVLLSLLGFIGSINTYPHGIISGIIGTFWIYVVLHFKVKAILFRESEQEYTNADKPTHCND